MKTTADKIISFYQSLKSDWKLPSDIELLYPFSQEDTMDCVKQFYAKYFSDQASRTMILGINPGRFGAGVTGVPFTDPWYMEEWCGIDNPFHKRKELSAIYIYELIDHYGGPEKFYSNFFISSVCPLGFTKDGININCYDDKALQEAVIPHILYYLELQLAMGFNTERVYILGKGKNYAFFKKFNAEHKLFRQVIPLPHPRWVMQYRRKSKDDIAVEIIDALLAR